MTTHWQLEYSESYFLKWIAIKQILNKFAAWQLTLYTLCIRNSCACALCKFIIYIILHNITNKHMHYITACTEKINTKQEHFSKHQ